jgi:hypothetical protein
VGTLPDNSDQKISAAEVDRTVNIRHNEPPIPSRGWWLVSLIAADVRFLELCADQEHRQNTLIELAVVTASGIVLVLYLKVRRGRRFIPWLM